MVDAYNLGLHVLQLVSGLLHTVEYPCAACRPDSWWTSSLCSKCSNVSENVCFDTFVPGVYGCDFPQSYTGSKRPWCIIRALPLWLLSGSMPCVVRCISRACWLRVWSGAEGLTAVIQALCST
jgi:hypothetical protein